MRLSTTALPFAALVCATVLSAQDPEKTDPAKMGEAVPSPVTPHHNRLAAFAGRWDSVFKMEAMPGVPGMEQAMESAGTDHIEMVCNGLFLKTVMNGSFGGAPFQGLWLVGYDQINRSYRTVWVDSMEPSPAMGTGTYDADSDTWTFIGPMSQGVMRSVVKFDGEDAVHETSFLTPAGGGEEVEMMHIARQRADSDAAVAVNAAADLEAPSKHHEPLLRMVGDWEATVQMQMTPGAPFTEETATERVTALCGGRWLWTDYRSEVMGMPFEGHALIGYDEAKGEYVSYWIDSWSPTPLHSTGSFDEASGAMRMAGEGVDMMGREYTSKDEVTWNEDGSRRFEISFTSPEGTTQMKIHYTRVK